METALIHPNKRPGVTPEGEVYGRWVVESTCNDGSQLTGWDNPEGAAQDVAMSRAWQCCDSQTIIVWDREQVVACGNVSMGWEQLDAWAQVRATLEDDEEGPF